MFVLYIKMDSKASNTKELMDINNLKYEEPAELALVESGGVFKKNNADQQVYTSNAGTELICTSFLPKLLFAI